MARPRPACSRPVACAGRYVKNRSKTRPICASGIPGPLSLTAILTTPSSTVSATSTDVSGGAKLAARWPPRFRRPAPGDRPIHALARLLPAAGEGPAVPRHAKGAVRRIARTSTSSTSTDCTGSCSRAASTPARAHGIGDQTFEPVCITRQETEEPLTIFRRLGGARHFRCHPYRRERILELVRHVAGESLYFADVLVQAARQLLERARGSPSSSRRPTSWNLPGRRVRRAARSDASPRSREMGRTTVAAASVVNNPAATREAITTSKMRRRTA